MKETHSASEGDERSLPPAGRPVADDTLLATVYERLRELARRQLAGERAAQTLNTTALVHEAWLQLAPAQAGFRDRVHFYAYAATAMRHILIDHARQKSALKRGGEHQPLDLHAESIAVEQAADELIGLDAALDRLDRVEPRLARIVELRFFVGLSVEEVADVLSIVPRSVVRDWARARAFLGRELA